MWRGILLSKQTDKMSCTLFIRIYMSFLEIRKGCLMRGCTKDSKKCTMLVGRLITLSLMMYPCLVIVLVFHNFHSFMTDTKINIKFYLVHMWEVIRGKRATYFLKEKWIVDLAKSVEIFVMVSISDLTTVN